MPEPFELIDDSTPERSGATRQLSPEQQEKIKAAISQALNPEERRRLETLLLERLKQHKNKLAEMLEKMSAHWTYEDPFYRFYHGSWKVYAIQKTTNQAVALLREMLPEREMNPSFTTIIQEGTGKEFSLEQNRDWDRNVRPMLEAFMHAKYMIEMAVRYADLPSPPQPMPSGWAAFLYLFRLR